MLLFSQPKLPELNFWQLETRDSFFFFEKKSLCKEPKFILYARDRVKARWVLLLSSSRCGDKRKSRPYEHSAEGKRLTLSLFSWALTRTSCTPFLDTSNNQALSQPKGRESAVHKDAFQHCLW